MDFEDFQTFGEIAINNNIDITTSMALKNFKIV